MTTLSISRRINNSPFTGRLHDLGVKSYTVYNHTLLATSFESLEADYRHLKDHVQVWDVSCEKQIELQGPDAAILLQKLTPRNMSKLVVGQCYYTPIIDETGGMLNDPVTLKLGDDRYWISIADSDLLLWVKGLAVGMNLQVTVSQPIIFPLAVQGPKSTDLLKSIFGADIEHLRFFRFITLDYLGQPLIISRSGFSKQGGFEIYVNEMQALPLWDTMFKNGADFDVRAGGPNLIERIEGGLLSYGNDMNRENTPHECGFGQLCDPEMMTQCIGGAALEQRIQAPDQQKICGIKIEGSAVPSCIAPWRTFVDEQCIGQVTSTTWSPDLQTNIAIAMLKLPFNEPEQTVMIETPNGLRGGIVSPLPFV